MIIIRLQLLGGFTIKGDNNVRLTIKWLLFFFVSMSSGSFLTDVLETTSINVWIARLIGCSVTLLLAMFLYQVFYFRTKNQSRHQQRE